MAEYIKKEDVLKLLEKNSITKKITLADGISIYDSVKNAPTADVAEVKRGKYIQKGAWHIECSECGHILAHIGEAKNYCPFCGADMRGDEK